MRDEFRFHVRIAPEHVDVQVLQRSVSAFAAFVRAAGAGRWVVSDLRLASVTAAARSVDRSDDEVDAEFQRIIVGLTSLTDAPVAPAGWDDEMLESVAALDAITDSKDVEGVVLTFGDRAPLSVHPEAIRNARLALETGATTLGAVTGKVDRFLSRESRREFGLVDEATGDKVTVRFTREREDQARSWIGQRVTAWGMLRRTPGGKKKELRMEGFEIAPGIEPLGVDQVVGALGADWTDGLSSVDWVRGQRGEG